MRKNKHKKAKIMSTIRQIIQEKNTFQRVGLRAAQKP
jgi:hypothetical protein